LLANFHHDLGRARLFCRADYARYICLGYLSWAPRHGHAVIGGRSGGRAMIRRDDDGAANSRGCLTTSPAGSAAIAETPPHFVLLVALSVFGTFCTFCITDSEKLWVDLPPMPRSTRSFGSFLPQPPSLFQIFEQITCLLSIEALSKSVSPDALNRHLCQVLRSNPSQDTTCVSVALA
jgi:hypothetical protein